MLKIGHFALLSQVSVKTLRFYDEIDLFKPTHVDRFTGYRYYSLDQLPVLNRILALKELGLSLEQVSCLVNEQVSAVSLREMLFVRRVQLQEQTKAILDELARYLHLHGVRASGPALAVWRSSAEALENEQVEATFPIGESLPETERIRVYDLPQGYVAAVVHHGDFDEFGQAYKAILRWIETNVYRITGPYREIYLQHDRRNLKETTTEIQFPIEKPS